MDTLTTTKTVLITALISYMYVSHKCFLTTSLLTGVYMNTDKVMKKEEKGDKRKKALMKIK